jgi:HK97 family phage major capsid protein
MESTLQLQQKRSAFRRSAESILDKCLREGRALRPGEEADLTGLEVKIKDIDRTFGHISGMVRHGDPGATFLRVVQSLAATRGNMRTAIERASVKRDADLERALSASVSTQGGYAVPTENAASVIEALRPMVAVRKLGPTILPMEHGNITWPRLNTGANATYLGENQVVPQSQTQSFAALRLTAKKLAAFVPVSNDLLRYGQPAGDTIVMQDFLAAVAAAEDFAFINGNGTQYTPRGLLNWVLPSNTVTANVTVSIANTDNDLGALETALINANVRMLRPGWIFSPRTFVYLKNLRGTGGDKVYPEMDNGLLRGYPFATSSNVPVNLGSGNQSVVILADFSDVVIGEATFIIDAATQSTYVDGGVTVSAFASDQTVVRIVDQHDLGMRHQESVAVLTGVSWIPVA